MRSVLRVIRHGLRLLPLVLVLALVVPGSGVRPTTIGLMKVQPAEAYDFADGVVWTLVLGEDAEGQTDLIQLLGINFRNGNAAAIGIPRDSWFELSPEVGEERINKAYATGGAELAADAVERLVGIAPDYVLVTDTDGFLAMVGTLGEVEVDSEFAFRGRGLRPPGAPRGEHLLAPGGAGLRHHPDDVGSRRLRPFAQPPGAAARSSRTAPRQGRRAGLHRDPRPRAVDGIDTGNLSPLDLYRLLNALTSVDPGRRRGASCSAPTPPARLGGAIVIPDFELAQRVRRRRARRRALRPGLPRGRLDHLARLDAGLAGQHDRLGAVRDVQLGEDVAGVVAHRLDRQAELAGDLGVVAGPRRSCRGSSRSRSVSSGNTSAVGLARTSGSTSITRSAIPGPKMTSPAPTASIARRISLRRAPLSR